MIRSTNRIFMSECTVNDMFLEGSDLDRAFLADMYPKFSLGAFDLWHATLDAAMPPNLRLPSRLSIWRAISSLRD